MSRLNEQLLARVIVPLLWVALVLMVLKTAADVSEWIVFSMGGQ